MQIWSKISRLRQISPLSWVSTLLMATGAIANEPPNPSNVHLLEQIEEYNQQQHSWEQVTSARRAQMHPKKKMRNENKTLIFLKSILKEIPEAQWCVRTRLPAWYLRLWKSELVKIGSRGLIYPVEENKSLNLSQNQDTFFESFSRQKVDEKIRKKKITEKKYSVTIEGDASSCGRN